VAIVRNHLVLARKPSQARYRSWERRREQVGTRARVPDPRGKAPGWLEGYPRRRPAHLEVVKKTKGVPHRRRKRAWCLWYDRSSMSIPTTPGVVGWLVIV